MRVINIDTVSKLVQKNATVRNTVAWFIGLILHLLESQRLIDRDKLSKVSLDWERGTLDLGDNFTQQLVARCISEYLINSYKKKVDLEHYIKEKNRVELFKNVK